MKLSITCFLAAVAIGFLAALTDWGVGFALIVPALAFVQRTRAHAGLVATGYYGAASHLVISAAGAFFGPDLWAFEALGLWVVATILLAAPYAVLWARSSKGVTWRLPVAILASVPPPLGVIGWASPLSAAGILFPGTAWMGLAFALFAGVFLCFRPYAATAAFAFAAVASHALCPSGPRPPNGWVGIDTHLGGIGLGRSSPLDEFKAFQELQARARSAVASVIVLPETILPVWTAATDYLWEPLAKELADHGKTVIFGARLVGTDGRTENVLVIRGQNSNQYRQRIPMPFGMWMPWRAGSASISPLGRATIQIDSAVAAPIICYEQFLTWPVVTAVAQHATVILAPANLYWARGTPVAARQRSFIVAWARLFKLPLVIALND